MFSATTYEDVASLLSKATAWLTQLGISHRPTRLGEYERALARLTNTVDRSDILREELPQVNNAVYEAYELIEAYESLAGKHDDALAKHLRAVASGPIAYSDENVDSSSNRARDFAFELAVMGYLAKAGLPLAFDSLADAAAVFEGRTMLFECKRPQSLNAVERRTKDALGQLKTRLDATPRVRQRGLVALDITKAVNPEFEVFVTQSEQDIGLSMNGQVDRFIENYGYAWSKPQCSRAIGTLIRLRQMSIVEYVGHSKLFHCQQIAVHVVPTASALHHELLRSFTSRLAANRNDS